MGQVVKTNIHTMFTNFKTNIMGTLSFHLKLKGWRKEQKFVTYPIEDKTDTLFFQSEKRWIELDLKTGKASMTNGKGGHPNRWLLHMQKATGKHQEFIVSDLDLQAIKMHIFTTADKNAGKSFVKTDNSGAFQII